MANPFDRRNFAMSGTDEAMTVTCKWFVKDAVKTESFPAKALKAKSTNPREMSNEELQEIIEQGNTQTNETLYFTVGDIVVLKSGGPLMTIVSVEDLPQTLADSSLEL